MSNSNCDVTIGPEDCYNGELKLILGLIWTLIRHYQIQSTNKSTKKALISFFLRVCNVRVTNFTTDWNDGVWLSKVIDYLYPGLYPDVRALTCADKVDNCRRAITYAQQYLGIPPIISVHDMVDPEVDELSMMTYLSYFIKLCIKKIREWAQSLIPHVPIKNMSTDWCSGINLTALINIIRPGILPDWTVLDEERGVDNITKAIGMAEYSLGIEPSLTAEEMACSTIDEMSVAEYLAPFILIEITKKAGEYGAEADLTVVEIQSTAAKRPMHISLSGFESMSVVALQIRLPSGKIDDLAVENIGKGKADAMYIPSVAGRYELIVKTGIEEVKGSPYKIEIPRLVDYIEFTSTLPPVLNVCVGQVNHFDIICNDTELVVEELFKVLFQGEGMQTRAVSADGFQLSCSDIQYCIRDEGNGHYIVEFLLPKAGEFSVSLLVDGEHIKGSPVNLKSRLTGSASGDGLTKALVGRATYFTVVTPVGSKDISVSIQDSQGELEHHIEALGQGSYKVSYTPRCTSKLIIIVKVNNEHVVGSPFQLDAIESRAYIEGRNLKLQVAASCVKRPLKINLSGVVDVSCLSIEIRNPLGHTDILQLTATSEGVVQASCVPVVAGKHVISMKIDGDDVPGSPFDVDIVKLVQFVQFENIDLRQVQIAAGKVCRIEIVSNDFELLNDRLLSVGFEGGGLKCRQISTGIFNPVAKEIQYSLKDESSGHYILEFMFPQDGHYMMSLLVDNEHISGSPFDLAVLATGHASQCIFTGVALTQGYVVPAGTEVEFRLDCSNAGEGELSVHAVGPQGESVKVVTYEEENKNIHIVRVYPERGGMHQLHVYWGGKPIPGCPFTFEACNPKLVRLISLPKLEWFSPVTGEVMTFDVDVSQAGRGQLTAYVLLPDGRKENFTITDKGAGIFALKHTFTEACLTQIFVEYSGVAILNGSITVRVAPQPNKCIVKQQSCDTTEVSYTIGQPIEFSVDCTDAGTGELTVKATGPDKVELNVDIAVDTSDDKLQYHIKVIPMRAGAHRIIVMWAGLSIPGSPFHYEITDPSGVKLVTTEKMITPCVGQLITYQIDLSNAGKGKVSAKVVLDGGKTIDVKVIDKGNGIIVVEYMPTIAGLMEIIIYFNGKKLTAIPVTVLARPEPSKIAVGFPKLRSECMFEAGSTLEFVVDISQGGGGELSATLVLPDNQELPIETFTELREGRKVCMLKITPELIGSYSIIILWAGQPVTGSPFKFEVADSRQITFSGLPGAEGFSLVTGETMSFSIDVSRSGKGRFVAQLVTADGSIKTLQAKESYGVYTIKERFIVTGSWRLVLLYNGKEIFSTPVEIRKAPEPTKCNANYGMLRDTFWNVGSAVQFRIDCTESGGGDLDVKVTDPHGSEIPASKSVDTSGGKRVYVVTIMPQCEGVYSIVATWAGKTIRGSPFSFDVANPGKVKILNLPSSDKYAPLTGETLSFEVDTSKAFRGKLTGQVITSSGAVSQLTIRERTEGIHVIKHKLTEPGLFEVKLFYNEVEILHFSFTVSMAPVASKCIAHFNIEKNQSVSVGQTVAFRVDCSEAGAGELTAVASCGIQKNDVPVHVSLDTTGGRCMYLVTLLPKVAGPYFVTILWADKPIPGSPFIFQVSDETLVRILNVPDPQTFAPLVGDAITFDVDTSSAGKGVVLAKAMYEGQQPEEFNANEKGKGLFNMKHVFRRAGIVDIPIFFNGTQLTSMTYTVKPAADASKCVTKVVYEDEYLINVNQLITLSVDCTNAGTGQLTAKCTNPQGNALEPVISEDTCSGRIVYKVQILPDVEGTYSIVILWAGVTVPGSPFTVDVADPSQVKFLRLPKADDFHPLTGDCIAFDIDATKAGKGSFVSKIICGDITEDVKIVSKGTGMYGINHVLSHAVQTTITVHYNGVQVLIMSFTVQLAPDASKCKIIVPEPGKYLTNVGQLIEFTVDCTEAGTGELEVKATGPRREITINTSMECVGVHKVQFSPDQAGTYSINVLWASKSVPNSPLQFEVADPNAVKFFNLPKVDNYCPLTGDRLNFDIDVTKAGKGELQVQLVSDGSSEDLKLNSKGRGMFTLQHVFERTCQLQVIVLFNGVQLVTLAGFVKLAPDASKCRAIFKERGEHLVNAWEFVEFTVDTSKAGTGALTAKVTGPMRKEVNADVTDCGDSYTVQFVPKDAGTYSVAVLWAGKAVPLSPFAFEIADPKLVKFLNLPKEHCFSPLTGQNVTFDIDVMKAGKGKLVASITTQDGESTNIRLVEKGKGVYSLKYSVVSVGLLQFLVMFNGVKVLGLECEAKLAPDSTKCLINLYNTLLLVGQPIKLSIDCSAAGVGKLTMKTRDPLRKELQTTVSETDGVYSVQADTQLVGEHSFDIMWSGKNVGSAPAVFNVFDPSKVKVTNLQSPEKYCAIVNETLTFEADVSKAGRGQLTCQVITADGSSQDVELTQKGQGAYIISYKLVQVGSIEVVLLFNNIKVFGSPWTCQVVDINQFKLTVPEQYVRINEEAKVEITGLSSDSVHLKVTATKGRQPAIIAMSCGDGTVTGHVSIMEVGEYKVEARYGNKMIPGSPLIIKGCNPDKCQFASQISTVMHVEEVKTLVVKSNEAGPGTLHCNISNTDLMDSEVKPGTLSSQINLTPKAVGTCDVTFFWAGFPVPTLQINAKIVNASLVTVSCVTLERQKKLKTGQTISFLIDGKDAGQGNMKFSAKGITSKYSDVDIVDKEDGTYIASFLATQIGKHTIEVTWGGKPAKDIPLIVDVKKAIECSSIRAEGDSLKLGIAGRKETVTIITKDTGLLADGDLAATMTTVDGYDNDIKPEVEIKEKGNGIYILTYVAELATDYSLNITHEEQPITDSPFMIDVKPAPDASKCRVILSETLVIVGTTVEVDIDCREAGYGELLLTVKDQARKNVQATVSNSGNIYTAKFNAATVSTYTIEAKWSGSVIGDGQYIVDSFDPSKIKFINLPSADTYIGIIGNTLAFDVDATKAGKGTVTAEVELCDETSQSVELTEKSAAVYGFTHTFASVGLTKVEVLFNGLKVFLTAAWSCYVADFGQFAITAPSEYCKVHDNVQFIIEGVTTELKHLKVTATHAKQPAAVQLSYPETNALAQFIPSQVGEYKIDVKYGGNQVTGSPFVVKACNPGKCKIIGSVPSVIHVKETKSVTFKTNETGPGELQHFLQCEPAGESLGCVIKKTVGGTLQCDLTAQAVGVCTVELKWSGFLVPDTPFQVSMVDASLVTTKCTNLEEGKKLKTEDKVFIAIDATEAGQADINVAVSGPSAKYKDVECVANGDGTFLASFVATQVGKHTIDVTWGGKPAKDIPLIVNVKKAIECSSIRAEGDALKLGIAGRKETVTIITKDTGLLADGDLAATMTTVDGYDNDIKPEVEIKEKGNGIYILTYVAEVATAYSLNITHEEQPITDSPFTIDVKPAPDASKCQVAVSESLVLVESVIEFDVDCREAGYGEFSVKVTDPAKKNVVVEVSENYHIYSVTFTATLVGCYTADVLWSGSAISGSPIKFDAFDPSRVVYPNLPKSVDYLALVGECLKFDIDASKAGKGQITTQVVLSESNTLGVEVTDKQNQVYAFKYEFSQAGSFELLIFFNDHAVLTDKWICSVVDMSLFTIGTIPEFVKMRDNMTIEIAGIPTNSKHFTVTATNMRQPTSVSLTYTDDGVSASFCTEFIGEYKVDMKYGGRQLAGSPVTIKSCSPDLCQISGQLPQVLHVNESRNVTIQTSKAGPGTLKSTAEFLTEGTILEHDVKSDVRGSAVVLKALTVGTANVGLLWADFPIPKVPFVVEVVDASLVTVKYVTLEEEKKVKTADEVVFEVDARTAGKAPLQFDVTGPRLRYKETVIKDHEDGTFTVSFIAAQVGTHKAEFLWGGKPVPKSPITFDVKKAIGISSIKADGNALKYGYINTKETVNISASDSGLLKDGDLSAVMNKVYGPDCPAIELKETGSGQYTLTYTASSLGEYQLHINYEDKSINNSPFTVDIRQPPDACKCVVDFQETKILAGTTTQFTVDCKEAGYGELSVRIRDSTKKAVQVKTCEEERMYTVSFEITTVGMYTVEVLWSGTAIPNTPITFDCFDPSKVAIKNLPSAKDFLALVGDKFTLEVDSKKAGKGELTCQMILADGSSTDIDLTKNNLGMHQMSYIFATAGSLEVAFFFCGHRVPILWSCSVIDFSAFSIKNPGEFVLINERAKFEIVGISEETKHLDITTTHSRNPTTVDIEYSYGSAFAAFSVTQVGEYITNVKLGGKHIAGSPFIVKSCDPLKCQVVGLPLNTLYVGEKSSLSVRHNDAGPGVVELLTEERDILEHSIKPNRLGTSQIEIIPSRVGATNVELTWIGRTIPDTPFPINIIDPMAVKVTCTSLADQKKLKTDTPAAFEIDTTDAGKADLDVSIAGPLSTYTGVSVINNNNNTYTASFTPTQMGTHTVTVLWGGKPAKDIPLKVDVKKAVDADKITASGDALKCGTAGKKELVTIIASESGLLKDGDLTAAMTTVEAFDDDLQPKIELKDKGSGTYSLVYLAEVAEKYLLQINHEGQPIKGSPFNVTIRPPPDANMCRFDAPNNLVLVNTAIEFDVDCREGGYGELTVKVKDPARNFAEANITDNNGVYTIKFTASLVGEYAVEILWSKVAIPGSPFKLNTFDPAKVRTIKMPVAADIIALTGESINFDLDVTKAGKGTLSTQVVVNDDVPQTVNLEEIRNGIFKFVYKLVEAGSLEIIILFNDMKVLYLPWMCKVVNFNKLSVALPSENFKVKEVVEFDINGIAFESKHLKVIASHMKRSSSVRLSYTDTNIHGQFTADFVGEYKLEVKYGNKQINGSPFTIKSFNPDNCQISDELITLLHVGETKTMNIRTYECGPSVLKSTSTAIEGSDIGHAIKNLMGGITQLSLTGKEVGTFDISLTYADFSIPNTPFRVSVVDASLVKVTCTSLKQQKKLKTGDRIMFTIDATEAGDAQLDFKVTGPSSVYENTDVTETGERTYVALFTATQEGIHKVEVLWGGKAAKNTPIKLDVKKSIDCSAITAEGDALQYGYCGKTELVTLLASDSGLLKDGDLTAVMKSTDADSTDGCEDIAVEMKDKGNGKYLLTYKAPVAGNYMLSIDYEEQPITQSPFAITIREPPNASKCQLQVPDNLIMVNNVATFTVDCTAAGYGSLSVTANDPVGHETEVSISETHNIYTVTFKPVFVGDYTVEALWCGKPIPSVPFTISSFDPNLVRFVPAPKECLVALTGESIGFDIDTTKAGKGAVTANAITSGEEPQEIKLAGKGKGIYILKYTFQQVGNLQITIRFNNVTILEYEATVKPQPDASKCAATILSTADEYLLNVSQTIAISVDCTIAGTGKLTVKCTGPQRRELHADIIEKTDQVYEVQLVPEDAGTYSIVIFWAGKPIPNSPYNFDIVDISQVKFLKLPKQEEFRPLTGDIFSFDIDVSKAGKGKLVAEVVSAGVTETLTLTEKGSRIYGVQHSLLHIGQTEVYVRYNGERVLSYMIMARAAPDSSRCKIDMSAMERESLFNVGECVELTVDCTEAGVGDLTSKAVGPRKEVEVNMITERDHVYRLQITPVAVGLHSLTIMWAGKSITTTPITFEVVDSSRVKFTNIPDTETYIPFVGEEFSFTVDTKNAGSAKVEAQIVLSCGSIEALHIREKVKGIYVVSYRYSEVTSIEFIVFFNKVKVLSFPCSVKIAPDASKCIVNIPTLEPGTFLDVGQMIEFTVDCTDAGYGELSLKSFGPQRRDIEVHSSLEAFDNRTIYKIYHEPSCAGSYSITVMWAGKVVPGGPFKFEVVDSKQVQFANLPSTDYTPFTGDVITFDIDISSAGKGKLAACVIQADGTTQDIDVVNKGVGIYVVKYTITQAGRIELCAIFNYKKLLTRTIKVKETPVATKCRSVLQEVQSYAVGQFIEFKVDCIDAGSGMLSAVAKDCNGKEVQVYISEHIAVYTLRFETAVVGKYTVQVFWSGKEIPNSPFVFETTDVSKISIVSEITKRKDFKAIVGKDICFDINVGQAGKGVLVAQVLFAEGGVANMMITEKDYGVYTCLYQPTVSGSIEIVITYGGVRILSHSMVICEAPNASKCQILLCSEEQESIIYTVGQTISFTIDCSLAGAGEMKAIATGPQGKQLQAKVVAIENNQYQVSFETRWVGTYSIEVLWDGNLIPGAPFSFEVNDPKRVQFIDLPKSYSLQAIVGKEITFDANVSKAGKGMLVAKVQYEDGHCEDVQVVTKSDEIYSIVCVPQAAGSITIFVMFCGVEVLNYPLTIKAAPNSEKCHLMMERSQHEVYIVGSCIEFSIDCADAGTGDLIVRAEDPSGKNYKVTLQEHKLTYRIKFEVSMAGQYKIEALWAGVSIPGCPFTFEVVDPRKLKFVNLPSSPEFVGVVGKAINFNVDVSKAGKGELTVQAHYSDGTISEFNKTEISPGLFSVNLVPLYTGVMDIVVYYSGNISITRSVMINKGAEASMCRVNLTALRAMPSLFVRKSVSFTVDCTEAGTGHLSVVINNPLNKPINADIKDSKGVFTVKFEPDEVGVYTIAIFWGDAPVPGSPFTVSAIDPKKIKFLNLPDGHGHLLTAITGQPINFTVDTTQAGAGNFNAQAVVEDGDIEAILMTSMTSGVYDITYTPHLQGNVRFDFWYNDVKFHTMNWVCQMAAEAKKVGVVNIQRTIEEEELQLTEVDALWIRIQMTTFKNWVNDVLRGNLKRAKRQVEVLQWDFRDGLILIALLECLVKRNKVGHYNSDPSGKIEKLENLTACFDLISAENIKLVNIGEYLVIKLLMHANMC